MLNGTEKEIKYANDVIKEWREHANTKKKFFESKKPNADGIKLLNRAMDILDERIAKESWAKDIIANRTTKKFDYEQIFYDLMQGKIK